MVKSFMSHLGHGKLGSSRGKQRVACCASPNSGERFPQGIESIVEAVERGRDFRKIQD